MNNVCIEISTTCRNGKYIEDSINDSEAITIWVVLQFPMFLIKNSNRNMLR
jgi:hypothetical protein